MARRPGVGCQGANLKSSEMSIVISYRSRAYTSASLGYNSPFAVYKAAHTQMTYTL